ncbi:MAG: NAD-dependent DNA ligase LigA, partial [Oscillospiraceae bacterium]|nr:NAD-dependent DNA ligase LigA [Oscillospiraceae bacterium]
PAKNLRKFERFVSKDGMDIDGLSIETLRDFVSAGFIHTFADIYHLSEHADAIREMEGFGEKSCGNLLAAIEKSRKVSAANFLNALCIPLIGLDAAKRILRATGWSGFLQRLGEKTGFEDVDGIGLEKSNTIRNWYAEAANEAVFRRLLQELEIPDEQPAASAPAGSCAGLTFVITGDVSVFRNRDHFKAYVEKQGGKVAGSVSGKTNYLVNNDAASQSSKNRKAQSLGVPILTEEEFIARFGIEE